VFPERLRLLREERAMSQEQLGRQLCVTKGTISMYETGKRQPDAETTQRIAGFFGVSVDYLWGRTDVRERPSEEELLAQLPPEVKAAFRGRGWADLDPETRKHIAWAISMDLERLKAKKREEEESKNGRTE
jgi:transcriptional regulator with XRE-family HTH domain